MPKYEFDREDELNPGYCKYTIKGQDYQDLLSVCFRYCTSFTANVHYQTIDPMPPIIPGEVEACRLPDGDTKETIIKHYNYVLYKLPYYMIIEHRHYALTDVTKKYLSTNANELGDWINDCTFRNLEDLTFFRNDGSIFMHSISHDYLCILEPLDSEDVSTIIQKPGWVPFNGWKLDNED